MSILEPVTWQSPLSRLCFKNSTYDPSGLAGWSLSRFLLHKAARNISNPSPEMDASSWQGYPQYCWSPVPIDTPVWRVSGLRTQQNDPDQGRNQGRLIWS